MIPYFQSDKNEIHGQKKIKGIDTLTETAAR